MDEGHCIEIRNGMRKPLAALSFAGPVAAAGFVYDIFAYWTAAPDRSLLLCFGTLALASCLAAAICGFALLRKRWRLDAAGIAQTGVFAAFVRWRDVLEFRIGKNERTDHCEIAILAVGNRRLRMDTADLGTGLPEGVARVAEFARENLSPPGSLAVTDVEKVKNHMTPSRVLTFLALPLALVFAMELLRDVVGHLQLLDFVARLLH